MVILVNQIQCNHCKDIIVSRYTHDYVTCKCGKCATDGGQDYFHRMGKQGDDFTDMSLHTNSPYGEIRKSYCRGGRGKDNKQPLTYVPLCEMSDEWLKNCIKYNKEIGFSSSFSTKMYRKELKYRKLNNISIKDESI